VFLTRSLPALTVAPCKVKRLMRGRFSGERKKPLSFYSNGAYILGLERQFCRRSFGSWLEG